MEKEFTFKLDDSQHIIHHWVFESDPDSEIFNQLLETSEWKNDKKFVARVTVNGVELPFESLEAYLKDVYETVVEDAEARYKDLDAEVQRRVEKRLCDEAQAVMAKFDELRYVLEDAGSILKPYWDKEK